MPEAKLLHVLGAGPWQLPTVLRARELGYRVLVTDSLPERPGYGIADLHERADISNLEATLSVARRHRISGIICDTTDTGVRTAAGVAERLGLQGIGMRAALVCTDKSATRAAAAAAGLPNPVYALLDDETDPDPVVERIGFPFVAKPLDNQSGRGVSIVRSSAGVAEALRSAFAYSRCRRIQIEACLGGVEHIVDGFVLAGKVQILGIASKAPYWDNPTIASRIDYLSGPEYEAAHRIFGPAVHSLLSAATFTNGVFHAEFMLEGRIATPIDLAARGGGVMIYTHVLPAMCGVDVVAASIHLALGQPVQFRQSRRRAARVDFLRLPPGTVDVVTGGDQAREVPGVLAVNLAVKPGDSIGVLGKKDDRQGFVVAVADDAHALDAVVRTARGCLRARMVGDACFRPFA